jgi:hypothetical protein
LSEPYIDSGNEYAAEGTSAHELAEYKLRETLGEDIFSELGDIRTTLEYYDNEMEKHTDDYVTFILEIIGRNTGARVLVEKKLSLERWIPESFGTSDCIIVAGNTLHVVDLKYGKRHVKAESNPQMMIYALGAYDLYDCIYDIEKVSMSIYQPRIYNISTHEMEVGDLLRWGDEVLRPKAQLAFKGEGEYACGAWCKYCLANPICRKRAEYNLELAQYDFAEPDILEEHEIVDVLGRLDGLVQWANDVQEYAFKEACRGRKWDGYKIVRGKSRRKISDHDKAALILRKNGFTEVYKCELLGLTQLGKIVGGAKELDRILEGLIHKPLGKPALVPESDEREAVEISTAEEDFSEPLDDIEND